MLARQVDAKGELMFAWLGDVMLVQPLRLGIDAIARTLRPGAPHDRPVRVPPMSSGWLRQHAADVEKHTSTL